MSDELLCGPCQRFLSGENPLLDGENGHPKFFHHTTAESFRQALALPCSICRRLRRGFSHQMCLESENTFEVAPTVYYFSPRTEDDTVEEQLVASFTCSDIPIWLALTPKATSELSRHFPLAFFDVAVADRSLASNYTGSDDCIDFVLSQLGRCRDTHTECQLMRQSGQDTNRFLPTRMIDVGHTGDPTICLVEADECAGQPPYIALSHCWGKSRPFQLTRSTAARLKAGVLLKDLPKTFQDAILVTRNMQIRYLWIDSLCITQDDPQDWHREAALMRNVYSRAICCIAATAAKDSDVGLFFYRDPQDLLPIGVGTSRARIHGQKTDEPLVRYTIHSEVVTAAMAIDNAPLNQRAWVAQERYLSTGTVHFTQELLFWECRESVTSEQDPSGSLIERATQWMKNSALHTLKSNICDYKSRLAITSGSPTSVDRLKVLSRINKDWCSFRFEYFSLSLTKEEDVFVALNGIAKAVAEVTSDTLVAGLWRGRLIEELCWRRHTNEWVHSIDELPRPSTWRAPTWSWASINRMIERHTMWWEDDSWLDSIHEMAAIDGLAVDQKPSGQLVNASLTLTCRLIPTSPPDSGIWAWMPHEGTVVLDDCTITNAKDLGDEVSLVILRHFALGDESGLQGILVIPSRVKTGNYERVGYFDISAHPTDDQEGFHRKTRIMQSVLDAYHNMQDATIVLI